MPTLEKRGKGHGKYWGTYLGWSLYWVVKSLPSRREARGMVSTGEPTLADHSIGQLNPYPREERQGNGKYRGTYLGQSLYLVVKSLPLRREARGMVSTGEPTLGGHSIDRSNPYPREERQGVVVQGNLPWAITLLASQIPTLKKRGKGMVNSGEPTLGSHSLGRSNPYPREERQGNGKYRGTYLGWSLY